MIKSTLIIGMAFFYCLISIVLAGPLVIFNDNGGWCWFQDERVIIQNDKLIISSMANSAGINGNVRGGDMEVTTYDITNGTPIFTKLHKFYPGDDHDVAALLALPNGKVLAMYTNHSLDSLIYYRIAKNSDNTTIWNSEVSHEQGARIAYSNLFYLCSENNGNGRIYNFYRGENYNPNYIISDDNGETWSYGGWLIRKDKERPYIKYTSNGVDKIYFVVSDAHPREYYQHGCGGTGIYSGYIYQGSIYKMDGTKIREITKTDAAAPEDLTKVYSGDFTHRTWPTDIHLDTNGHPYFIFSVHVASSGSFDGSDLRYWYARWDGTKWYEYPLAYAGSALYSDENDYSGLVALDSKNPNIVYISTNANPKTGAELISKSDRKRHYEIFKGTTNDGGATWTWHYITKDSPVDNIRPIVPVWDDSRTILLWMRGTYTNFCNYNTQIVGMIDPEVIAVKYLIDVDFSSWPKNSVFHQITKN